VATLPPEGAVALEVPPWEPPVDTPPVVSEEHPKSSMAPAKALKSVGNRSAARRGLRPECLFVIESSCILVSLRFRSGA
jgi:hypothetical protein